MAAGQIKIVPKLKSVFAGKALVRCAWGGRGSGKTRSFAIMAALKGYEYSRRGISGIILCARQFQNSIADSSLEEIKRAIEDTPFLRDHYEMGENYIRTRNDVVKFRFTGLEKNVTRIKSMGRILICWVDEAQPVSEKTWHILMPTLREHGEDWHSELWVTWNPLHETCAVERLFRHARSPDIRGVEVNWRDNPAFPPTLEKTRLLQKETIPHSYEHIWEGKYDVGVEHAYYHREMSLAEEEGRICWVRLDPHIRIRAFWDIGGTGSRADATSIWIAQFVAREIRVLDYYEATGQPLSEHIAWLRRSGYGDAIMTLPHDGSTHDRVSSVTFESSLIDAGFDVDVYRNKSSGIAMARIEAVRRLLSRVWFNKDTTHAGRKALCSYHQRWDENRRVGLGPKHDWSSHAADAFGLMCLSYEEPRTNAVMRQRAAMNDFRGASWMSAM